MTEATADLRGRFDGVAASVADKGARPDVVVGFATSMEKVLPRAGTPPIQARPSVEVRLARNEKESFQVVVLPTERDARQVSVQATDLRGPRGAVLARSHVECQVVGYVRTQAVPPYGSSHVGWWPDPILDFQHVTDVARGDAQAFWVRVRAPRDQPPGAYRGKLVVSIGGVPAYRFDLSVRVWNFTLPDASPLPLAVTFAPMDYPADDTAAAQEKWRKEPDYPINAWRKHRLAWGDFLADYYLTYDTLYGNRDWQPDFEILQRLHAAGKLGRFNLGYYGPCGAAPGDEAAWKQANEDAIRPRYERAKALGLLDHAYIYGCDEAPADLFPTVQRAAERLRAAFPGVPVMTTTYDDTFGAGSPITSMDGFCPLTPRFETAAGIPKAREAGKEVWWYICCGPHHPHANMFVEYPAIEGRLLMGAMTAKYRPDGFLYYEISIWNSRRPIGRGPFTDWDPRSWTTYHGDGSWTCVGPDGTPLPTIRLENFRDGLEDYAVYRILEETVRRVAEKGGDAAWLARARKLLQVPPTLVKSMTEYSRDPAAVYRWRNGMARAIETAGVPAPELDTEPHRAGK